MRLDELKSMVAKMFENATEKEQVEQAAQINAKIEEVAAEQQDLLNKNKELLDSYKDVVLHTSVKPDPNITTGAPATGTAPKFEDALEAFVEKEKANGGK